MKKDVILLYYLELAKTNYLHWGLWAENDEINLENFQKSQERYMDHLISFIPKDVKTILDVGCGVGGNAIKLKERGYDVTSVSPDLYQQKLFKERTNGEIKFLLSRFEDLKTDKKYDMIFMSESVQYIPMDRSFTKARELLKDGGYILSSDYFKLESVRGIKIIWLPCHFLNEYLDFAKKYNFKIIKEDDISGRVVKTLYYGNMIYFNYIKPTMVAVLNFIEVYFPPAHWAIRVFFNIKVKGEKIEQILKNNIVPMKPENFTNHMKYEVFLFRKE